MTLHSPRRRTLAGITALVASTALSAYYFFGVENGVRSAGDPWRNFYSLLHPGWIKLSEQEIRDVLRKGNAEPMTLLAIRTALGRWRLKDIAPEAFPNVMHNYQQGLWLTDDVDAWTRALQWLDENWKDARRRAHLSAQPVPPPSITREGTDGLIIVFPEGTSAHQLGSRLRIAADAPPNVVPEQAPKIYWETEQAAGVSPYRRRLTAWDVSTTTTAAGMHRVSLELDLSWEPFWIAPGVRPKALHLRNPGASKWRNIAAEFDDSPLLPVR
ncbi:MAG: hypothetical protein ACR2IE_02120 [Candidatus Sumerlaeaceae bacterium]